MHRLRLKAERTVVRLLLVARSMETGGTQRQIIELASRADKHGVSCEVVVFYAGGELLDALKATGVRVHVLGKRGRYDVFRFAWRLSTRLRRFRADVVYSFLTSPSVITSMACVVVPGTRVVWGVRGSSADLDRYDPALRVFFAASRLLARFADLIICNSQSGLKDHEQLGYPSDRMIVIPNGIDTSHFHHDAERGRHWRAIWGASAHTRIVVVPARLDPMKGHRILLQAAEAIASQRADLLFVLVGPGPDAEKAQLEQEARLRGLGSRVVVQGGVEDMVGVYSAADLVVLPSLWGEGFPNVIGEAMACGVPAVVSDVGDSAFVVGPIGEVAQPGDVAGLASALLRALRRLDNDAGGLRAEARLRIESLFAADAMARMTIQAARELL